MTDAMKDDNEMDRAYRAALLGATPAESADAVRRRRQAVLAAVEAAVEAPQVPAEPRLPVASNEPRWRPLAAGWRGAAAASVLVCTALVALRVIDEPPAPAPLPEVAVAPKATAVPAPATVLAPAPAARSPAREQRLRNLPAPPAPMAAAAPPLEPVASLPAVAAPVPQAVVADRALAVAAPRAAAPAAMAEGQVLGKALAPRSALLSAARPAPPPGLLAAVLQGDAEAVRRVLAQHGPDNERDADGRSALMLAVLRNDAALATLLLQHGADRLAIDRFGQSAQGYAQAAADPAMLKAFGLAP